MVERVRVGAPRFPRRQAPPGGSTLAGDRSNAEELDERAPADVEQAPPDSERAPSEPEQDQG